MTVPKTPVLEGVDCRYLQTSRHINEADPLSKLSMTKNRGPSYKRDNVCFYSAEFKTASLL